MRVRRYTKEQIDFVKEEGYMKSTKEITRLFNEKFGLNITENKMKSLRGNHKINSGLTGRFEKGQVPANKGKRWNEYMSKESQESSRKTTFKKGNISYNNRPIGDERLNIDGYWYIKIKDGHGNKNWKLKHHILWEKHNGLIPKGKIIVFLDDNPNNIVIENLEMIDRGIHVRMNKNLMYTENRDLTKTGILVNKLERTIKERDSNDE